MGRIETKRLVKERIKLTVSPDLKIHFPKLNYSPNRAFTVHYNENRQVEIQQ